MADLLIAVNGRELRVTRGTTAAAAMLQAGVASRVSVTGEPRSALCGMGVCFECRAVVDGIAHRLTCQILCTEGMSLETMR